MLGGKGRNSLASFYLDLFLLEFVEVPSMKLVWIVMELHAYSEHGKCMACKAFNSVSKKAYQVIGNCTANIKTYQEVPQSRS